MAACLRHVKTRTPRACLRWGRLSAMAWVLGAGLGLTRVAADGVDWPMFRGNPELTGVAGEALVPPLRVRWTVEAGAPVDATAAIAGETVYVAASDGRVMALRLKDGERVWDVNLGAPVSASPAVLGTRLYIARADGQLSALDTANGTAVWVFKTEGKITASPTIADGRVFIASYDHKVYAVHADTGKLAWAYETDAPVHGTVAVAGGLALASGCDGVLVMLDVETGRPQRRVDAGVHFAVGPALAQGQAWLGSVEGDYRAVRVADAETIWHQDKDQRLGACHAQAAVSDKWGVFASRNRRLFALDSATGMRVWTFSLRDKADASPVISGAVVYAAADDGTLYALNLADGKELWRFPAGAPMVASPAIGRGVLVIGTKDGALYCLEPQVSP